MRDFEHYLFYSNQISDNLIILDEKERHHCVSVMRAQEGDLVQVSSGDGNIYVCEIKSIDKQNVHAIAKKVYTVKRVVPEITFFVGLPEENNFEWLLENVVPLGIKRVVPLICQFTQKPWWKYNWERTRSQLQKKMIVGMKQSKYPYLPSIEKPEVLNSALNSIKIPTLLADQDGKAIEEYKSLVHNSDEINLLIGPPGGFSPIELELLQNRKEVFPVKVCQSRLRTEIAAFSLTVLVRGGL